MVSISAHIITVFSLSIPYPPVVMFIFGLMGGYDIAVIVGTHHIKIVSSLVLLIHVHIWVVQFLIML
jgi:hypothetical protein